jgi:filamentous hemagglutinin family protein
MVENRSNSCWVGGMFAVAIFGGAIAHSENNYVLAQIEADNTLGTEASIVTPQGSDPTVNLISGGATRGDNLFHSFDRFSILIGRSAYFNNATNIQNIISRVTGGSISNIDGLLRANGTANLFLLNPNGIIFGANARLDIGGSFVASTATGLNFADGTTFSATAAQTTPLLTVSVPIGLQYGTNAGSIVNQSRAISSNGQAIGLQVKPSKTLALVGGNVSLDGGIVRSPDSRVQLGGLTAEGTVGLNFHNGELRLNFPNDTTRADVLLDNAARVDVAANGGGSIAVTARELRLLGKSSLVNGIATRQGAAGIRGGDIAIDTTGATIISQSSSLANVFDNGIGGRAGNIYIKAGSLTIDNLARVSTGQFRDSAADRAASGDIFVETTGSMILSATDTGLNSAFSTLSFGDSAGNISVKANGSIDISDSEIVAASFKGAGGTILLQANDFISITNNSFIASNVFEGRGDGGNITLKAGGPISINNLSWIASQSGVGREQPHQGNGGNFYIQGKSLSVTGGAQLSTRTYSFGNAGNIEIETTDFVEVSGRYPIIFPDTANDIRLKGREYSLLQTSTETGANGMGGEIRITTGTLRVFDGGSVNAQSRSAFRGGNIIVNADVLELNRGGQLLTTASNSGDAGEIIINATDRIAIASTNPNYFTIFNQVSQLKDFSGSIGPISPNSGIFANTTEQSTGRGGSLQATTKELIVRDGGEISVSSQSGNAGDIAVAADSMRLEAGSLTATTRSGNGGNISLQIADSLLLRRNSSISATAGTAQTGGDGGNINIDTKLLVALENSEIAANAFAGRGGNIQIGVQGLFISPDSRISATSARGIDGVVAIENIDVDPSQGLVALPVELVDASNRIVSGCTAGGENQFVVTGRGGLPPTPRELLNAEPVLTDWATLEPVTESSNTIPNRVSVAKRSDRTSNTPSPIVEATAWQLNEKNEVVLMAASTNTSTNTMRSPALNCNRTHPTAEILLK